MSDDLQFDIEFNLNYEKAIADINRVEDVSKKAASELQKSFQAAVDNTNLKGILKSLSPEDALKFVDSVIVNFKRIDAAGQTSANVLQAAMNAAFKEINASFKSIKFDKNINIVVKEILADLTGLKSQLNMGSLKLDLAPFDKLRDKINVVNKELEKLQSLQKQADAAQYDKQWSRGYGNKGGLPGPAEESSYDRNNRLKAEANNRALFYQKQEELKRKAQEKADAENLREYNRSMAEAERAKAAEKRRLNSELQKGFKNDEYHHRALKGVGVPGGLEGPLPETPFQKAQRAKREYDAAMAESLAAKNEEKKRINKEAQRAFKIDELRNKQIKEQEEAIRRSRMPGSATAQKGLGGDITSVLNFLAFSQLTSSVARLSSSMLEAAGSLELYKRRLEVVTKDQKVSDRQYKFLMDYESHTPFKINEVMQAGVQNAIAKRAYDRAGFDQQRIMRLQGELATLNPEAGLAEAQKVTARLAAGDFHGLMMARSQFGASTEELKIGGAREGAQGISLATAEDQKKALEALEKFVTRIGGGNLAVESSYTLKGSLSTLESASLRALDAAIEPLVQDFIVPTVKTLTDALNAFAALPAPIRGMVGAATLLTSGFLAVATTLATVNFGLRSIGIELTGEKISTFLATRIGYGKGELGLHGPVEPAGLAKKAITSTEEIAVDAVGSTAGGAIGGSVATSGVKARIAAMLARAKSVMGASVTAIFGSGLGAAITILRQGLFFVGTTITSFALSTAGLLTLAVGGATAIGASIYKAEKSFSDLKEKEKALTDFRIRSGENDYNPFSRGEEIKKLSNIDTREFILGSSSGDITKKISEMKRARLAKEEYVDKLVDVKGENDPEVLQQRKIIDKLNQQVQKLLGNQAFYSEQTFKEREGQIKTNISAGQDNNGSLQALYQDQIKNLQADLALKRKNGAAPDVILNLLKQITDFGNLDHAQIMERSNREYSKAQADLSISKANKTASYKEQLDVENQAYGTVDEKSPDALIKRSQIEANIASLTQKRDDEIFKHRVDLQRVLRGEEAARISEINRAEKDQLALFDSTAEEKAKIKADFKNKKIQVMSSTAPEERAKALKELDVLEKRALDAVKGNSETEKNIRAKAERDRLVERQNTLDKIYTMELEHQTRLRAIENTKIATNEVEIARQKSRVTYMDAFKTPSEKLAEQGKIDELNKENLAQIAAKTRNDIKEKTQQAQKEIRDIDNKLKDPLKGGIAESRDRSERRDIIKKLKHPEVLSQDEVTKLLARKKALDDKIDKQDDERSELKKKKIDISKQLKEDIKLAKAQYSQKKDETEEQSEVENKQKAKDAKAFELENAITRAELEKKRLQFVAANNPNLSKGQKIENLRKQYEADTNILENKKQKELNALADNDLAGKQAVKLKYAEEQLNIQIEYNNKLKEATGELERQKEITELENKLKDKDGFTMGGMYSLDEMNKRDEDESRLMYLKAGFGGNDNTERELYQGVGKPYAGYGPSSSPYSLLNKYGFKTEDPNLIPGFSPYSEGTFKSMFKNINPEGMAGKWHGDNFYTPGFGSVRDNKIFDSHITVDITDNGNVLASKQQRVKDNDLYSPRNTRVNGGKSQGN